MKFIIRSEEHNLFPEISFYESFDFMGEEKQILALRLYENNLPYAVVTKNFGEFIGLMNTSYIDINNCPWAVQLIEQGYAVDTGFHKDSGFCSYPLYQFTEKFFALFKDNEELKKYWKQFDL